MATLIYIIFFIASFLLVIGNSVFKRKKLEYIITLDELNRKLNRSNLESYRPVKTLGAGAPPPIFGGSLMPEIIPENLKNFYYRQTIKDFKDYRRIVIVLNFIFIPIVILSLVILIMKYPDYLLDLLENDSED